MTQLAQALILIAGMALFTLLIGLPLLLPRNSPIPDTIGLFVLAVAVLAFAWLEGSWWTLLPVLAIAALVSWMDRKPEQPPYPETGMSERSRARFRLWRAANRL